MRQTILTLYAVLLSLLFGIVFTIQVIGFFGLYTALIAIPITLITSGLAYIGYTRITHAWRDTFSDDDQPHTILQPTILITSLLLLIVIFLQRQALFPASLAGEFLSGDFLVYHTVKALSLYQSGAVWDLSIPYGQYPYGYEGMITFGLFFVPNIAITGMVHVFVTLVFWLTIVLLIKQFTDLAWHVCIGLALAMCFSPVIFPVLVAVGKNDMLLSTSVLIAVLHAPIKDDRFHPMGLAFATMISLATKASGLYILFYLWGIVMLRWAWHWRIGTWREFLHPATFVVAIAVMFPGGLWVIRNYLVMGELFTSEVSSFFVTTIAANWDNPVLHSARETGGLAVVGIISVILIIMSLFKNGLGWRMAGLLLVTVITFTVTPLSAFPPVNLTAVNIEWRYVMHGIVLLLLIGLIFAKPLIQWLYKIATTSATTQWLTSGAVVIAGLSIVWIIGVNDVFYWDSTNAEMLLDPTNRDNSIYDELATLPESVIYLEYIERLPIMLRNPDLTITELRYPLGNSGVYPIPDIDYIAFVPRPWRPEITADFYVADEWEIIFEDESGHIYQRIEN